MESVTAEDAGVIVVGAGLIGLALARELHRQGLRVTIFDAGEAGRGASWAGAGMISGHQLAHPAMRRLGEASGKLYRTWAPELERETGLSVGYRPSGTLFLATGEHPLPEAAAIGGWQRCEPDQWAELEPELERGLGPRTQPEDRGLAIWRIADDHSIDNRLLAQALIAAVRARGIALIENTKIEAILPATDGESGGNGTGARLSVVAAGGRRYPARVVVNAAGAWAGAIEAPVAAPVRPRKGQMVRLRTPLALRHVLEVPGVYLVPRAGGSVLAGATLEDVGFDAEVSNQTANELKQRAASWLPGLSTAEIEDTWIGYRPCSSDDLPLLGPTRCPGYWLATAHFRDGILLTPITAKMIAKAIATGQLSTAIDWEPFSPGRFA